MQKDTHYHLVLKALLKEHDAQDNIRCGKNLTPQVQAGAGRCHTSQGAQRSCCDKHIRLRCMLTQRLHHMLILGGPVFAGSVHPLLHNCEGVRTFSHKGDAAQAHSTQVRVLRAAAVTGTSASAAC